MNGRMKSCEARQKIADAFIEKNNPYVKREGLKFDMRGYALYVKENGIATKDITPSIMNMFSTNA